jgi:hypothetical protein
MRKNRPFSPGKKKKSVNAGNTLDTQTEVPKKSPILSGQKKKKIRQCWKYAGHAK